VTSFEFTDLTVSDQFVKKMFERVVDPTVISFKEDELMPAFVDFEEKPLFPGEDDRTREQTKLMVTSPSIKEIRTVIANKTSGLKVLAKGRLNNIGRKLKAARLAVSLDSSKKEAIELDVNSMIEKFYSQNQQAQVDVTHYKPQDKYGTTTMKLSQVSPMMQVMLERNTYKKINEGTRKIFGVCSDKILNGNTVEELATMFDMYMRDY